MTRVKRQRLIAAALGVLIVACGVRGTVAQPGPTPVTLRFAQTEIATVLTALAQQVGFDVVVGPGVSGETDLQLADVDWRTALDAIAAANGLSYHWNDGVLVVHSGEAPPGGELAHHVVNLRYADPTAVKEILAGALSSRGIVQVLGASASAGTVGAASSTTPVLLVSELPYRLPAVLALIDSLDIARPQFEIGVKFVETSIDDKLGLGLSWPTQIGVSVADYDAATTSTTGGSSVQGPIPSAEYDIPDGKIWRFGTLTVNQLSGFLEFLDQKGNSRLLSDPRVTVLENETATMRVTQTFPIQTVTRFTEGAATQDIVDFQEFEVGLTLTVTPRLNNDGVVSLAVEPTVEEITGFVGTPSNQRPITANRSVKTTVRVADSETLVIGGLVRETEFTTKTGVWLLGDIPILGALFSHKKVETKKTDLLIFITPRVLADAGTS